jgi:hypothetical protein
MRLPAILFAAAVPLVAQIPQSTVLTPDRDNTLYQEPSGSFSNGQGPDFFAGVNLNGRIRRGILRFDVAAQIPAAATITSVQLQLEVTQTTTGPLPIALHRVTADWGEGASVSSVQGGGGGAPSQPGDATWIHTFYPSQFWTNAGGDFVAAPSFTGLSGAIGTILLGSSPGMVADVQAWLAAPANNFGWIVLGDESNANTGKRYASRENPNPAIVPMLIVAYTVPGASVSSSGMGCAGAFPGVPFALGPVGSPALPLVPNPSFGIQATGAATGDLVAIYLASGLAPVPVPLGGGCDLLLDLGTLLLYINLGISPIGPLPVPGSGVFTLPVSVPPDPGLIGLAVDIQALRLPPSGPFSTSNALSLVFGF